MKTVTIPAAAEPKTPKPGEDPRFDRQDVLLLAGVVSLEWGIAMWSLPAALVVFGLICLGAVRLIGIEQNRQESKGADGSAHK